MLLLGGFSCVEAPHVGQGRGAGELARGLEGEATGTGAWLALAETASSSSFDSGCSIRFRLLGDWVVLFGHYRVKRIQRLSAAARFSQPAQGFIPIA
jgi:hypothetical protein